MGNVGFIGVGYMGYGIAKNILEKDNNLFVIANKNRKPIEKIVSKGAVEVNSFEDFRDKELNVLVKSTLTGSLLVIPNFLGVFFFNLNSPSCLTGSFVFVSDMI